MTEILDRVRLVAEQRRDRQRRMLDLLRQVEQRLTREAQGRSELEQAATRLTFERDEAQAALAQAADERDAARAEVQSLKAEITRLEGALNDVLAILEDDGSEDTFRAFEALLGSTPATDGGIGHNSLGQAAEAGDSAPPEVEEEGQVFTDASLVVLDPTDSEAPPVHQPDSETEKRLRVLEDFLEQGLITTAEYDRRRSELTRTAATF